MTKTSHKKNRPFDFKLIDLVEPHPVLYQPIPGMSTFEVMKTKSTLWQQISNEMGFPVQFCLSRWNNLRGQFQKELRHCTELCPKSGLIRGSTWPYLNRLKFLEATVLANRTKKLKLSKRKLKELQQLEQQFEWRSEEEEDEEEEEEEDRLSEEPEHEYNIEEITDNVEHTEVIEETYIADEDYSIIEEIAEEVVAEATEHVEHFTPNDTMENYRKMQSLLDTFEEEAMQIIERRLLAFLCKCQLRALSNQTIDDLFV
ncbi:uncharacterized protein LOC111679855 [Lucilia cuprina]|uniref:uncharacterized protein LOC111679855 n=1 Tax=Lucilia cuprina TaxID=7375 RepID=UPI001F06CB90|nr:uncharacterized protein LOC111679855 [Lucilia cuprina]